MLDPSLDIDSLDIDPRDPLALAADAPLFEAWLRSEDERQRGCRVPFSIPGHKGRTDLIGTLPRGSVPLYAGLAPIKEADALVRRAEALAAAQFGADWVGFSVGGSSHGNQAVALALGRPGRQVVVSRTVHRSVLLALVMADLVPVWVHPELDHDTGLPLAVTPAAAAAALDGAPDACALWLTDPSYVGTCGDVAALASVAHARDVPLVVDAAWGAHFGAHPRLPAHPFALGADAVVTSFHKTLPALDQAAVVMARTDRLDPARLQRGFEAGHTTSPSGSTLASIDAARALLGRHGHRLAGELVDLADRARARLRAVPGLAVAETHGSPEPPRAGGAVRFDAAKLVVLLHGTGAHGHAVERDLLARGLTLEMADRDVIIPMLTIADTTAEGRREVERMLTELTAAVERHRAAPRRPAPHAAWTVRAEQVLTPRQAFFATHEAVPWHRAAGRVSAEIVAPYPPGVPVLAPGERVTREALDALTAARDDGGRVAYAADPTLETLQVVRGYGP